MRRITALLLAGLAALMMLMVVVTLSDVGKLLGR